MFLELRTPLVIQTELSRTEIVDRIDRVIDTPGLLFPVFGSLGLVGRAGPVYCWFENGGVFRKFNRRLTLRYEESARGTVLRGEFALPILQLIPLCIFFGAGIVICFAFAMLILNDLLSDEHSIAAWQFAPFGIVFAGFLMMKFNLWLSRASEAEVVETLETLFKGHPTLNESLQHEIVIRPRRFQK